MRFASLGSGSRGNATLIEAGDTRILLDCGFSLRQTEQRLARLGCSPDALSALVVTHEHSDHANGVLPLAARYGLPVWATAGTWRALGEAPAVQRGVFSSQAPFAIGAVEVCPFTVPHDAREPCQFVFSDGARRLGVLTDSGSITPHIRTRLSACDALILECNHDPQMLEQGRYPPLLKRRVGGRLGHLSNAQAAALLQALDCTRLQHLVAAHLSEHNNRPALAVAALSAALGCAPGWVAVAGQDAGLDWRELG